LDEITEKTYRSLEWERLKNFLTAEAESALGQHLCHELKPANDLEQVERRLDETEEAMFMLQARSGLSAAGLPLLEEHLARLEAGASLSGSEFGLLKTMLKIAQSMKTAINLLPRESFPRIFSYNNSIYALPQVKKQIEEIVDDQGNVIDSASDLLYQLRREVARLQTQISTELQKIIHASTLSKALQEPIFTLRNGRFVLPVNANQRAAVPGIVHDSSASGLTVYIEPLSVLELSNKKRLKESEIEREIIRILDELGRALQEHIHELKSNYETTGKLDAISARARLSIKYDGRKPELSKQVLIDYKQARHPLLVLQSNISSIVANDIAIGDNQEHQRTLVITGPNTGGKTVLLKTIGIFALMVRSGLLLPVGEHSTTCIFNNVYADIGDEQSLEQSLSTFSSHMQNIVNIVDRASRGTLVLLDEVGAGTDPREGAALAKSLLEFLNGTGAMTIATTHFSELKTMAYSDHAFLNGSLEFNEITLSPSYRLKLGVPGSSKAMTIAHRLGLNDTIVRRANELVTTDDKDFQATIDQLEKRMLEMENRERRLNEATEAAQRERLEYEQKKKELTVASERTRSTLAAQLNDEFQTSKEYVRHLIAELQKEPGIAKAQKVQKELDSLRKELGWLDKANTSAGASKPRFTPGQSVKISSLNQRGILVSIAEKKSDGSEAIATVKAGSLNLKVPVSDLELSGSGNGGGSGRGSEHESRPGRSRLQKMTADMRKREASSASQHDGAGQHSNQIRVFVRTSNNTLDIRGQRVDEGLANLDQFLNQAMVNETSPLMVIHGHGTGALKSAVRDALASNNALEQYRPGENHEGGDGVTIVEL
jgi:DNA mismatch repair protein MutS2